MALKNYTTEVPANRSISEIQEMLKSRVSGARLEYEAGTGRIQSLAFKIDINGQPWGFRMPLRCVGKGKNKRVKLFFATPDGLPVYEQVDMLLRKRR